MGDRYILRRQAESAVLAAIAGLKLWRRKDITAEILIVVGGTHTLGDVLEAEMARRELERAHADADRAERELADFEAGVAAGRGDPK